MRLSRVKLRTLIESIILENEGSRAPVPLSAEEIAAACIKVKCPDDKKANAVGFRGFNTEGNMIADIEAAIRKKLGCRPSECVIKQTERNAMIFVGWEK